MLIGPIKNPDTGMWEVKQVDMLGASFPLPAGMLFEAANEDRAKELCWTAAEQLDRLGIQVGIL